MSEAFALDTLMAIPPDSTVRVARMRNGATGEAHVTLTNEGDALAFFIRLQLVAGDHGAEVLPVEWSDNYVSLLPGEKLELTARYALEELHGHHPAVEVAGWNSDVCAGALCQ